MPKLANDVRSGNGVEASGRLNLVIKSKDLSKDEKEALPVPGAVRVIVLDAGRIPSNLDIFQALTNAGLDVGQALLGDATDTFRSFKADDKGKCNCGYSVAVQAVFPG